MKLNLARYTSPFSNPWAVVGESLMLPVFAIGLGLWINPLDPLWVNASFPWIWFAPVLLALRYGPFPGLAGAAILLVAWVAFSAVGWPGGSGEFPKLYFLGGLILVMVSGEFSSLWVARARRAETTQVYLDQRLEYLTHQYYLLRLSHDRLEQDLISRPVSMREALTTLRQITLEKGDKLPGADALMRLFAQYCQLEVAGLYAATRSFGEKSRRGVPDFSETPLAMLGQSSPLDLKDPLVVRALEGDSMWHVQKPDENTDNLQNGVSAKANAGEAGVKQGGRSQKKPGSAAGAGNRSPSRYLIVAPLVTYDGERVGLLTVERLPFFALHGETLQTLELLLGYYTDGLAMRRLAEPVRAARPDCPPEFASELARLARVARDSDIASLIVALEFVAPDEQSDASAAAASGEADNAPTVPHAGIGDLPEQIQRQKRMLDVNWLIRAPDGRRVVLVTLMPLAGEAAAEGYLARIEQWVRQQRGQAMLDAGVFPHQWIVSGDAPSDQLANLLALCHVHEARPLRAAV